MAKLYTLFRTKRSKSIPCPAAHPGREGVHLPGLKWSKKHQLPYFEMPWQINVIAIRSFSHDVTAAIFIYKKMNRRPCLCTIPVGIELFSHVKTFFCSKQFAKLLTTWLKTIYITMKWRTSILRVWTDFKCFFKCFFSHYRRPRFVCFFGRTCLPTPPLLKLDNSLLDQEFLSGPLFCVRWGSPSHCP